jgi:exodeoxyribonuclease-3
MERSGDGPPAGSHFRTILSRRHPFRKRLQPEILDLSILRIGGKGEDKPMKPLRIISWNVNGLRAAAKHGLFEWFAREQPDFLCLQETKIQEHQIPDPWKHISGYRSHFASAEKKGYSGTAVYYRIPPETIRQGMCIRRFDSEGRVIGLEYKNGLILNVYFPNGKASPERLSYKMDFYESFLDWINGFTRDGKFVIFCGDVNTAHRGLDLARPKENEKVSGFLPEERAWIDKLIDAGYVDAFRIFHKEGGCYTWWDVKSRARERNVGWRIDYFFVSQNIRSGIRSAAIQADVFGSDHCPIGLEIELDL